MNGTMPPANSLIDSEWELFDPTPNPLALFTLYNKRFFWNKLGSVTVDWSPRMTSCAGICCYEGRGGMCKIRLSQPLLKLRPRKDLVETLLHEMIHAYLFVTHNNRDRDGHGPEFQKHMKRINDEAGTRITIYHSFHHEVRHYQTHWWKCDGPCQHRPPFFGMVKRATARAPGPNDFWWSDHQNSCGGKYRKVKEPEEYTNKMKAKEARAEEKRRKQTQLDKSQIANYFSKLKHGNALKPGNTLKPGSTPNHENTFNHNKRNTMISPLHMTSPPTNTSRPAVSTTSSCPAEMTISSRSTARTPSHPLSTMTPVTPVTNGDFLNAQSASASILSADCQPSQTTNGSARLWPASHTKELVLPRSLPHSLQTNPLTSKSRLFDLFNNNSKVKSIAEPNAKRQKMHNQMVPSTNHGAIHEPRTPPPSNNSLSSMHKQSAVSHDMISQSIGRSWTLTSQSGAVLKSNAQSQSLLLTAHHSEGADPPSVGPSELSSKDASNSPPLPGATKSANHNISQVVLLDSDSSDDEELDRLIAIGRARRSLGVSRVPGESPLPERRTTSPLVASLRQARTTPSAMPASRDINWESEPMVLSVAPPRPISGSPSAFPGGGEPRRPCPLCGLRFSIARLLDHAAVCTEPESLPSTSSVVASPNSTSRSRPMTVLVDYTTSADPLIETMCCCPICNLQVHLSDINRHLDAGCS